MCDFFCLSEPTTYKTIVPHQNPPNHDDVIQWKHFPRYWPSSCVTGGFPSHKPVTRSFGVFFNVRLDIRLSTNNAYNKHKPAYITKHFRLITISSTRTAHTYHDRLAMSTKKKSVGNQQSCVTTPEEMYSKNCQKRGGDGDTVNQLFWNK